MSGRTSGLRSAADFRRVYQRGRNTSAPGVSAKWLDRGDSGPGRAGMVVSKKNGKAVARNRIRRRLKEALRQLGGIPDGVDGVLIARPEINKFAFQEIKDSLWQIMENITKLKKS